MTIMEAPLTPSKKDMTAPFCSRGSKLTAAPKTTEKKISGRRSNSAAACTGLRGIKFNRTSLREGDSAAICIFPAASLSNCAASWSRVAGSTPLPGWNRFETPSPMLTAMAVVNR